MRKILFFLIVCNFVGCVSVEKYNSKISEKIDPKKLKSDVAFTYRTLQKYHPNLYWYISKDKLDSKFDSLQKSIASPATSFEFYKNWRSKMKIANISVLTIALISASARPIDLLASRGPNDASNAPPRRTSNPTRPPRFPTTRLP